MNTNQATEVLRSLTHYPCVLESAISHYQALTRVYTPADALYDTVQYIKAANQLEEESHELSPQ